MNIRKSIYSLSQAQIDQYVSGVKILKTNGSYNTFVDVHFQVMSQVHGTPLFLPWHRASLMVFEQKLQEALADPTFSLPYWDWTDDVTSPGGIGQIWNANIMGGTGMPVATGPFVPSEWVTISPDGAFGNSLFRSLGNGGLSVTTTAQVLATFAQTSYDDFRRALEAGPHGNMHVWVGGQMASVPNSPNDPVFWLHHCNIDRIWAQWQQLYPNQATEAQGMSAGTIMPQMFASGDGVTVGSVNNSAFGEYYYEGAYSTDISWSSDQLTPTADNAFGTSGGPALAVFNGKLYCVRQGRGDSGWTWCASFDGNSWSTDELIPSADNAYGLSSSPALAVFNDKLYCIRGGQGDSGWTWCASFDGNSWSTDELIPSAANAYGLSSSPALAVFNGKLYCARGGRGDSGWTWCASFDGNSWSTDELIPSADNAYGLSSSPALAVFNGKLYCVRQGRGDSGWTWCASFDGNSWSTDELIPSADGAYGLSSSPALAVFNGKLYCIRGGRDDSGWTWCASFDGNSWSTDELIPSADDAYGLSSSPALAVFNGELYCAREGRSDSGWVWCGMGSMNLAGQG